MVYISFQLSDKATLDALEVPYFQGPEQLLVEFETLRPVLATSGDQTLAAVLRAKITFDSLVYTEAFEAIRRVG
jgi:hypothetical protein